MKIQCGKEYLSQIEIAIEFPDSEGYLAANNVWANNPEFLRESNPFWFLMIKSETEEIVPSSSKIALALRALSPTKRTAFTLFPYPKKLEIVKNQDMLIVYNQ